MSCRNLVLSCATILTAAALSMPATPASAAGFYLQESSVSGVGAALSGGATNINDASTIWFNPAGITQFDKITMNAGAQLLFPYAKLTDRGSTFGGLAIGGGGGGNPYEPEPIPNAYIVIPLNHNLTAGIGTNAPFGLSSDYGNTWFGRYDATFTMLQVANTSAVLGYKINDRVSIGGGIDIQYATARLEEAAFVLSAGTGILKGDDMSLGWNIGIKAEPVDGTTLGASYRYGVTHKLDGYLMLQGNGAANYTDRGYAKLNLPDIYSVGITQDINDRFRVMANVNYYFWSDFKNINPKDITTGTGNSSTGVPVPTIEQNYKNTTSIAIGGEYDYNKDWTFRAGYQYDPTPTQDSHRDARVPDGNRNFFAAGATYRFDEKLSVDFSAAYIMVSDERINTSRNGGQAITTASTESHVGIAAIAFNYSF